MIRDKQKDREKWVCGLAVILAACLVLGICSSAHAFPHGVAAGYYHTVGLKSDGTEVAVGRSNEGQLGVGSWSNIVQVAAGYAHTVGLTSDGTVVAVGLNDDGQLGVATWKLGRTNKMKSDFNGDGKEDLVWRNPATGRTTIWYMDGATWNGGYADVEPTVADANWQIVAIRDFNNDGIPDLLWRNTSTYRTTVWYMNGPTWNGNWGDLLPIVSDPNWIIVGR